MTEDRWEKVGKQYEDRAYEVVKRGPWRVFWWVLGLSLLLGGIFGIVGMFTGAANNAAQVARKEFYPDALLRKYEWFKDASAQLDKKLADLKVYETREASLKTQYVGLKRSEWAREDREQQSIWSSERAGVAASYNALAAEYNAQMSKFNWRFTNVGDLPPGASMPLPRSYKPYLEE